MAVNIHDRSDGQRQWLQWAAGDLNVVYSTRRGGVSTGSLAALNLGFSVGDEPANVRRNRGLLCAAIGVAPADLVVPAQVHGRHIMTVGAAERGRGAVDPLTTLPDTDGLMTVEPGLPLTVSYADCLAVAVGGHDAGGAAALALAHAGWRGLIDGIVTRAVHSVREHGAAETAVIGPSIGPCCFVVAEDLAMSFAGRFGPEVVTNLVDGWHVDLWQSAMIDLRNAGVADAAICVAGVCTSCDARFYSHRRDRGATGRQAAIAWITPRRENA
jgi:YfiH family protein